METKNTKNLLHRKKTLLFKNAIIDIFKNWVQFIILTVLVLLSGVVFTLMWTTTQRMNETIDHTVNVSNMHDAILEENFVARSASANSPLMNFDDHGVNANYVQVALDDMQKTLQHDPQYAGILKGKPFFTFDRRESRMFAKTINNVQYLFKIVAYAQDKSASDDNAIQAPLNTVDNLIDATNRSKIKSNVLQAFDNKPVDESHAKNGLYTIAVDSEFAIQNNLHTGDFICPTSANDNSLLCTPDDLSDLNTSAVAMRVVATGYSADLAYPMLDETTVLPDNKVDGVIYVNPWLFGLTYGSDAAAPELPYWHQGAPDKISLTSNSDKEVSYNIVYNDNLNATQANKAMNDLASKYFVLTAGNKGKFVYNWNDANYRFHNRTSMIFMITSVYVSTLSIVLIVFMVICFAVMVLLIQKQINYSVQKIATLKALGYSRMDIYSSYAAYPLMVGLIGGILGYLIGTAMQNLPINAFQTYFMAPFVGFSWDAFSFVFSFIILTVVLVAITMICCFAIISQNYLKLQSQVQHVRFIQRFQWMLNHINPRNTFKVRFNNAVFAKSIGKVSTTLVALFIGTALITISVFAPKSVNEMMNKTYLNAMNDRAGETHYELPTWNNPLSIYRMYNIDDRLPAQQNVASGDMSAYNYEPFHYNGDIASQFNSAMGGMVNATYMASVGAANLPNSYWQIYDKNYLSSLDQIVPNQMMTSQGALSAGIIAIPEYGPAVDMSSKDQSEWSKGISPDTFANKYKVKNEFGGTTYYTIAVDNNHAISQKFKDQYKAKYNMQIGWNTPNKRNDLLTTMPINVIIKTGMLDRSPWFVRDRLMSGNLPYGDAFGLFPYNSKTDELAMYFNPVLKKINDKNTDRSIKIDAYGIDPSDKNQLVKLRDDKGVDLNAALLNSRVQLQDTQDPVYPVVINEAMARSVDAKVGDVLTIDPNNPTEVINNKVIDPFNFQNHKVDFDYGTIDFNENPTFNNIKNSLDKSFYEKYYASADETKYHLSRQLKMSSIKQSGGNEWVGDKADNYAGARFNEITNKYENVPYLDPTLTKLQKPIYAVKGQNQNIGDINPNGSSDDPKVGFYNSWSSELQTSAGKMIYDKSMQTKIVSRNVKLKVIGTDDSYGNSKMYVLNHNNYDAKTEKDDQNYAEQILQMNKTKDYLAPIFLEQINGKAIDASLFGAAPFSNVVMHYWNYTNNGFAVNDQKALNLAYANDASKLSTIHGGMYYDLPKDLRQTMNYMYPVYNAKFTKSMALDDVMSNLTVYQKDGDYTRISLGGGSEFGEFASPDKTLYPQYSYGSLTYSATLSQEYKIMSNFVNLIMVALYFFVAIALMICLMIIVFTANIIIQENKRMITTMKVLGYRNREIVRYVLGMYSPVIIVALILGIVGGYYIFKSVIIGITAGGAGLILPVPATWWIFLIIVLLIIFIYMLSLLGSYLTLRRTQPVDALKEL